MLTKKETLTLNKIAKEAGMVRLDREEDWSRLGGGTKDEASYAKYYKGHIVTAARVTGGFVIEILKSVRSFTMNIER